MFRLVRISAAVMIAGFALLSADSASAAVLLPDLATVLPGNDFSASVTSESSNSPVRDPAPRPDRVERDFAALPTAPASSAGPSPGVSGPPTGVTAVATVPVRLHGDLLVAYLHRESRVLLPVPFLSGVFRPPRCVG